jgi:uncharacterized membrane protein YeaQ/YmgE (transglycosylase-associated protein family)
MDGWKGEGMLSAIICGAVGGLCGFILCQYLEKRGMRKAARAMEKAAVAEAAAKESKKA